MVMDRLAEQVYHHMASVRPPAHRHMSVLPISGPGRRGHDLHVATVQVRQTPRVRHDLDGDPARSVAARHRVHVGSLPDT